jgi:hypothetical protein
MFSIIVNQLRFKKLPISEYESISAGMAWMWMVLIGIVMNSDVLLYDRNAFAAFGVAVIFQTLGVYSAYLIMVWWLKKQDHFDGNGNLWGLIATASTIDIVVPFVAMLHPIAMVVFAIASFFVFYNALKSGLSLGTKSTVIAILVVTGSVVLLSILFGVIVAMSGLPIAGIEG